MSKLFGIMTELQCNETEYELPPTPPGDSKESGKKRGLDADSSSVHALTTEPVSPTIICDSPTGKDDCVFLTAEDMEEERMTALKRRLKEKDKSHVFKPIDHCEDDCCSHHLGAVCDGQIAPNFEYSYSQPVEEFDLHGKRAVFIANLDSREVVMVTETSPSYATAVIYMDQLIACMPEPRNGLHNCSDEDVTKRKLWKQKFNHFLNQLRLHRQNLLCNKAAINIMKNVTIEKLYFVAGHYWESINWRNEVCMYTPGTQCNKILMAITPDSPN